MYNIWLSNQGGGIARKGEIWKRQTQPSNWWRQYRVLEGLPGEYNAEHNILFNIYLVVSVLFLILRSDDDKSWQNHYNLQTAITQLVSKIKTCDTVQLYKKEPNSQIL